MNYLLVILSLFFLANETLGQDSTDVVMYVDGEPVESAEIAFFLEEAPGSSWRYSDQCGGVLDRLGQQPNTKALLRCPSAVRRAIGHLLLVKVQQRWMMQYGIKDDTRFSQFQQEWQRFNQERRDKVARGEVIYGQLQYRQRDYFFHRFDNEVLQLKRTLSDTELAVSEQASRQYYEQHLDDFHEPSIVYQKFTLPIDTPTPDDLSATDVVNHAKVRVARDTLDEEQAKRYDEQEEALLSAVRSTSQNTYSPPFRTRGGWVVVRPQSRFIDTSSSYDGMRADVVLRLQNERYDQLICQRLSSASITIDTTQLTQLCDTLP